VVCDRSWGNSATRIHQKQSVCRNVGEISWVDHGGHFVAPNRATIGMAPHTGGVRQDLSHDSRVKLHGALNEAALKCADIRASWLGAEGQSQERHGIAVLYLMGQDRSGDSRSLVSLERDL
jgi:hypothetical protein